MKIARPLSLLLLSFILSCLLMAQRPAVAAAPSWIAAMPADYTHFSIPGDGEDGYAQVFIDWQANLALRTIYHHHVLKILTEAGIQNASEVSVSYDPGYQRLTFHTIRIIRDGRIINKLEPSKIKTVHEETELSRSLYNGQVTSVLFLEDVRKGDMIEYAYSVQGFNPVFRDKFSTTLAAQYGVPIGRMQYKIICPAGRKLNIKNRLTAQAPQITAQGTDKVYQWAFDNVAALKAQDGTPSWYDPYPSIEVSEFADWKEVVQWALPLFLVKPALSEGLKKKIAAIDAASGGDATRKVLAALRFVQDEVRYMGIEMGVNSHKPNDPDKIFAQRFGDCKDKSFLLVTMLKAMNIDAAPVLINTDSKRETRNLLPSPLAFDHCTVRAKLAGKTWWFDPTISFQRGHIDDISYPDYQCGLVLTDTTTDFTEIPLQDHGEVVAEEDFTISEVNKPVRLDVVSRYTGSFADDVRDQLNSNARSTLQKSYLDFYNVAYEDTKVADSMRVEDSAANGMIVVHEYYTINKLWSHDKGQDKAEFDASLIRSILKKPKEHDRTMPIELTYPSHYTEELRIHVPDDWEFEANPKQINAPGFIFNSVVDKTNRMVDIKYEYQTVKDHVNTDDAAAFFSDYEKLQDDLGYELTEGASVSDNPSEGTNSWNPAKGGNLVKALICLGLIAGITYAIRRR